MTREASKQRNIQKRIRDCRRLLNKDISPDRVSEILREVQILEEKASTARNKARENLLAAKYKYVKFVERNKIQRAIAQLEKKIQNGDCSKEARCTLYENLASWRYKLYYINFYPVDMKYISILKPINAPEVAKQRDAILEHIANAINERYESLEFRAKDILQTKAP